ncbi:Glutamyl-tRNA(Gln) amidotransferase subunit C [Nymphon striatum]|nr:Glutamyl-tRNA(Gln) amidotransferase subunit C [Nymphon striatum]
MSVDTATVKRVAKLARIAVTDDEATNLEGELNTILGFVEQLSEVDVSGVEPMVSVVAMDMKKRIDEVTDGNKAEDIVANAPATDENFFQPAKSCVLKTFLRPKLTDAYIGAIDAANTKLNAYVALTPDISA